MLDCLVELFPNRAFSVADIIAKTREAEFTSIQNADGDSPAKRLRDAVNEIAAGKNYRHDNAVAQAVGYWFRDNLGVRVGETFLEKEQSGNTKKSQRYRVAKDVSETDSRKEEDGGSCSIE